MLSRLKYHWNHHRDCITKFPLPPIHLDPQLRPYAVEILGPLAPQTAKDVPKKRYGSRHDGGYVMLDDFNGITRAFSLGIGRNVWWDLAMAEKGLTVWQFDHTVDGPPRSHPNFTFHKMRIGSEDEPATPSVSLSTLIKKAKSEAGDLILKIDIEGSEWEVFARMNPDDLGVFRQILVEFHDLYRLPDAGWRTLAAKAVKNLTLHHQVVHAHGNNFSAMIHTGDLSVPDGFEITLGRRNSYTFIDSDETFPGPLDRRNNPYYADMRLGKFSYA